MARPTKYNEEIALKICEMIAHSDRGLVSICKELDLNASTVYDWINNNAEFSNKYLAARSKSKKRSYTNPKGSRAKTLNDYRASNAKKTNQKKFGEISYIYIINIEGTEYYKIGVSNNPDRRIKDIEASMPFVINILILIKIINSYEVEEKVHNELENHFVKREWFKLSRKKVNDALKLINKYGKTV